ncbi:MAG TPA: cytochrome c [Pyrinomonadaceae bacterium]|jgi:mono/diheme cytochrome c family protein|nr:cytochrome c [Pyrinomonadaceae bacterium]
MKFLKLAILTAAAFAFACAAEGVNNKVSVNNAVSPAVNAQPVATVSEIASGKKFYTDNCAACHRENGTGGPIEIKGRKIKPDNLTTDKIKSFPDEKIAGYIKNGIPDEGMPSFKDKLNDAEIAEIIHYVRAELQKQ